MSQHERTPEELRAALAASQRQVAEMAAAQGEFLRAVSHDLRAPLRHFTSFGALVREVLSDLPAEVGSRPEIREAFEFLTTMDGSARRMGCMLDGLLTLARAGQAPLRPEPVRLGQAVRRAQEQALARLAPPPANVVTGAPARWRVAPDLPVLQADGALLHDMLVQLLGNALKFSRACAQPVIAIAPVPAPPGHVAFTIEDNGAGFDPARAGHLFGIFQRLHRESEFEGVGAGLALCRLIAVRHGAEVTATAWPGAGCTVRVQWPAGAPGA
jgi:signal transduction histidine kinase